MAARVTILFAATALFAVMWTGDRREAAHDVLARNGDEALCSVPAVESGSIMGECGGDGANVNQPVEAQKPMIAVVNDSLDSVISWECFPECFTGYEQIEISENGCYPKQSSEQETVEEQLAETSSVDLTVDDYWTFGCWESPCPVGSTELDSHAPPVSVTNVTTRGSIVAIPASTTSLKSSPLVLSSADTDQIPVDNLWTFEGCDIPLPSDIAPGEYRIVNDQGSVQSVQLTESDLAYYGIPDVLPPRNFYIVHEGDQRWYFIRVETSQQLDEAADENTITAVDSDVQIEWTELSAFVKTVNLMVRGDVFLTLWHCEEQYKSLKRHVASLGRQSTTWTEVMAEAFENALKRIQESSRMAAEEKADRRLQ